ncbi:hypothetical protein TKK_0013988 [Trichogramma kaykai]|uniref:Uncharacterized protein n=1 Tax=Trichogramma kaykai TaxID=54128 RepID=A0ABD2WFP1_9HYME
MPHITEDSVQIKKESDSMYKEMLLMTKEMACVYFVQNETYQLNWHDNWLLTPVRKRKRSMPSYEVFLGGSCNPTTWRKDIVIPVLSKHNISFYNPQVDDWNPTLVKFEASAKQDAKLLLFVIDDTTRNCAGIVEASALAASRTQQTVLVLKYHQRGQTINGEVISDREHYELVNAMAILEYLYANRNGDPTYSIEMGLQKVIWKLRGDTGIEDVPDPQAHLHKIDLNAPEHDFTAMNAAFGDLRINEANYKIDAKKAFLKLMEVIGIPQVDLQNPRDDEMKVLDETYALRRFASVFMNKSIKEKLSYEQIFAFTSYWLRWIRKDAVRSLRDDWMDNIFDTTSNRDLYLGFFQTENDYWHNNDASIKLVEARGFSFYRPCTDEFNSLIMPLEYLRMEKSAVVVLEIPQDQRALATMAVVAHLIELVKPVVISFQNISMSTSSLANGEKLTETARKDYNRGRAYLMDMIQDKAKTTAKANVFLCTNVEEALGKAISLVKEDF